MFVKKLTKNKGNKAVFGSDDVLTYSLIFLNKKLN